MRISRPNCAILVLALAAVLGSFGPALDGNAVPAVAPSPDMTAVLSFETQTFTISMTGGGPNGVGVLELIFPTGSIELPVTFDLDGEASLVVPISAFNNGFDLVFGLRVVVTGDDDVTHASGVWAFQSRNYVVTDPENPPCVNCPTTPGGTVEFVLWPGASSGPTFPLTRVGIYSAEERDGGQPMLVLESGPAGSFPIN